MRVNRSDASTVHTVAAIIAHMHNVRVMWLKAAKAEEIPEQLDRATVTPTQALRGFENSRHALSVVISGALKGNGKIRSFRPDVAGFIGFEPRVRDATPASALTGGLAAR